MPDTPALPVEVAPVLSADQSASPPASPPASTIAFAFGDAESVLDRRELFDLFEVAHNGRWYEPPIPHAGLGRCYRMAAHHQSAILLKRNLLVSSFVPSRWLSKADFARWALDWLIFGNAYLEVVPNLAGRAAALRPAPAAFTRVGLKPGQFFFVPGMYLHDAVEFRTGSIHHLVEPDPMQEIYGMPEYLSALQSGLLNESATLFRRKYYINGSHAGYILHVSDENFTERDSEALREAMRRSKGPGNFRNFFIHIPRGKPDGVKIIPIGEVGAKDAFTEIKDMTAQDMLAAHRVPPQLLGIVPKNTGGFGNVVDAARTFYQLEIVPIQQRMAEVNDWLGAAAVTFQIPDVASPATPGAA
ncbi:phage portal protein [Novosphingobium pituita]|jgi:PBSX family phage portal protein|uniref:Phage portal protein n=1 Tax=Novosphingobium pituita TaxID=3056842 RepID=A0ABQ6P4Y7_9SPHN|nr:phage portal protein [Novosphingobium sp. IK01]GMM59932.1 phage portal protein [Novosphingobium sp. IK01]HIQ18630.1 phage portal protein [Novosphingobium capsulatum]